MPLLQPPLLPQKHLLPPQALVAPAIPQRALLLLPALFQDPALPAQSFLPLLPYQVQKLQLDQAKQTKVPLRGGFASRSKKQGNEPNGDKYMVDMNQNEFGSTAGAGIAAPLSPFENRRFVPSPQPMYAPSEPNNDYQEGYSQAGYSQAGYSQDAYHSDGYGYYGYPQDLM
ncbi:hypothetical protein G6F43_013980 [Rhizopus delemar]|nr:hypothetical protein G6F43_013980 [Rhizopus delemar]